MQCQVRSMGSRQSAPEGGHILRGACIPRLAGWQALCLPGPGSGPFVWLSPEVKSAEGTTLAFRG